MNRNLSYALIAAALLWFVMFSPQTAGNVNFWGVMSSAAVLLLVLSLWYGRDLWKQRWQKWQSSGNKTLYVLQQIGLGIVIAAVLWGVFWIGDKVSQWMFPSFARMQVDTVYALKEKGSTQLIGWLMLCLIGPAEEIFWRGYVQASFCRMFRANPPQWLRRLPAEWSAMIVSTAVYTLIHLPAMNFMLLMSALVCGVIWGGLYAFRRDWLPAVIVSHALWDAAVFVWFPIM
ncbi:MAG: CPBP family intramembrane metalloprotease [Paludibacteraceae bacterium]|nr:CPBP family intramembrane metalloprotease [Paludibacteraceae bacterium]